MCVAFMQHELIDKIDSHLHSFGGLPPRFNHIFRFTKSQIHLHVVNLLCQMRKGESNMTSLVKDSQISCMPAFMCAMCMCVCKFANRHENKQSNTICLNGV